MPTVSREDDVFAGFRCADEVRQSGLGLRNGELHIRSLGQSIDQFMVQIMVVRRRGGQGSGEQAAPRIAARRQLPWRAGTSALNLS